MREVLFRGRDEDGVWREGYYCVNPHNPKQNFMTLDWALCQVVPKAIGQYIGLNDSEGEGIFEGDILERRSDKKINLYSGRDVHSPWFEVIEIGFYKSCFCRRIIKQKNYHFGSLPSDWEPLFYADLSKCKIIGNIHDNPELLQ